MPTNLINTGTQINTGNDSIVIQSNLESIPGGKSLDTTGFTPTSIQAGHIVIVETATGIHKPHPVSGATYAALPALHTHVGVVVATVATAKPFVGVCVRGRVNKNACPYPPLAGAITALTGINFVTD